MVPNQLIRCAVCVYLCVQQCSHIYTDEAYYWKPSTEEQKLLSSDTLPVAAVPTAPVTGNTAAASPPALGLRGLYNLGNTYAVTCACY